ncbi:hypothetical protein HBH53_071550 [Parastagonospora nodorum]|nr:hypothetical protein HBH53_071550 [Parastagonospora nodorum]
MATRSACVPRRLADMSTFGCQSSRRRKIDARLRRAKNHPENMRKTPPTERVFVDGWIANALGHCVGASSPAELVIVERICLTKRHSPIRDHSNFVLLATAERLAERTFFGCRNDPVPRCGEPVDPVVARG